MKYVVSNLMKNEKILYEGRTHWSIYIPSILLFIAFILMVLSDENTSDANMVKAILFGTAGGLFIDAYMKQTTTELAITDKRIIAKFGFISRKTIELNHTKVESLNVDQSVLGRILNYGNVEINGTGGMKTPIPNISNPLLFRKNSMEIINNIENELTPIK